MPTEARTFAAWTTAWLLLALAGATLLVRLDIAARRADFAADAADVHRLIGQRAAQHDAILATLALLDAVDVAATAERPWARLPALYPQLLDVARSDAGHARRHAWWRLTVVAVLVVIAGCRGAGRTRPAGPGAAVPGQTVSVRWWCPEQVLTVRPAIPSGATAWLAIPPCGRVPRRP